MIEWVEQIFAAAEDLRGELSGLATFQSSESFPEDVVLSGETLIASIDEKLKKLLSLISSESFYDDDTMRDLVLGGDTVCVSFLGDLGAGCLYLEPSEKPLMLEDLTSDRALSRFWSLAVDVA
jgi:hypothetical protein